MNWPLIFRSPRLPWTKNEIEWERWNTLSFEELTFTIQTGLCKGMHRIRVEYNSLEAIENAAAITVQPEDVHA